MVFVSFNSTDQNQFVAPHVWTCTGKIKTKQNKKIQVKKTFIFLFGFRVIRIVHYQNDSIDMKIGHFKELAVPRRNSELLSKHVCFFNELSSIICICYICKLDFRIIFFSFYKLNMGN